MRGACPAGSPQETSSSCLRLCSAHLLLSVGSERNISKFFKKQDFRGPITGTRGSAHRLSLAPSVPVTDSLLKKVLLFLLKTSR